MGEIIIKAQQGSWDKDIQIDLSGKLISELAYLQHCIYLSRLGNLEDVRSFYDKFLFLCKGKQYKYISKHILFYLLHMNESFIIELFESFDYKKESI